MINNQNKNKYNLEERTFVFAKNIRPFVKNYPKQLLTEKIPNN